MTDPVMHVVCLRDTGHVLAALTTNAGSEAPKIEDIAGTDLMVTAARNQNAGTVGIRPMQSPVPTALLELKTAPFKADAIANPLAYTINGGAVVKLPNGPPPAAAAPALDVDTITLNGVIADVVGLAVVSNANDSLGDRRVQSGTFDDPALPLQLVLPLTLMPDDTPASVTTGENYDIMFAIQGIRLFWGADTP